MRIEEIIFAVCLLSIIIKDKHFNENAILLAHKIEIRPNKEQEKYLLGAVGSRRFAYNHLVAYYNEHKKLTKIVSVELIKELRAKYKWLEDFSTRVIRNCIDDLDKAIKRAWSPQTDRDLNASFNINSWRQV